MVDDLIARQGVARLLCAAGVEDAAAAHRGVGLQGLCPDLGSFLMIAGKG